MYIYILLHTILIIWYVFKYNHIHIYGATYNDYWQPGRYLLLLSPLQWVFFTPSTSPTRCQVSDSFRCGVGLRACDGEVPRNVSPSTWPMLNLVDLDDSELVWPNTRELTKPPNNPQPKKQTNKQTNWAKLGIQKFVTCWGLEWYQKCKEDQPLKSKQIKHTASTFNSAARLFAKPKNKTAHNVLLRHLLQFSCFTNTSASIIRQVTIPYPSRNFPTDLGFWSLRSSPAKHPSDVLGKKCLAARCHQKKGDGGMEDVTK